jgi:hypothetical protein
MVAVVLLSGGVAMADSLAERLEKGIYTEETVGDLDAARDIYQQIVADAETDRVVAAQAQFRLAQCFLKQEKKDEAIAAFKKLIEDFADQKELVAKAKRHVPIQPDFEMLPEPWVDGESLQLQIKLPGGLDIGTFVFSVSSSQQEGKDIWLTNTGRYIHMKKNSPNQGISRVKADRNTFRPISSLFRHSILGQFEATYSSDEVTIKTVNRDDGKQSTRKTELGGIYYDNEQAMLLFRRLPLAKDFKATIPIFATFAAGAMEIEVEVTALETIDVPVGKFECYRLLLPKLQQTYWISTDEHRYPVKFEGDGLFGVLETIRINEPGKMVEYRDDKLGFSLSTPSNWYFVDGETPDDDEEKTYHLLDPEAVAMSKLEGVGKDKFKELLAHIAKRIKQSPNAQQAPARAWLEFGIKNRQKSRKNFIVRPDSWKKRTIFGHPGISYIADYIAGEKKMVYYVVCTIGETTAVQFQTKIERDKFDSFRGSFDAIVDTYREKSK